MDHRERMKKIEDEVKAYGSDILLNEHHKQTRKDIQHGRMSVRSHMVSVAECSLLMAEKLHIPCDRRALVRGALLHDFFLYDWHNKEHANIFRLHGFFHPGIALRNAEKEFPLSEKEKDIIKKHMWPLTIAPPVCREAWIVSMADKYCSMLETLRRRGKSRVR